MGKCSRGLSKESLSIYPETGLPVEPLSGSSGLFGAVAHTEQQGPPAGLRLPGLVQGLADGCRIVADGALPGRLVGAGPAYQDVGDGDGLVAVLAPDADLHDHRLVQGRPRR